MPRKTDPRRRVVDAAMKLAAERGWRDLTLAEIASAAGTTLSGLYPIFAGKPAVLAELGRIADEAMLADGGADDPEETPRDRLFDVVMRRFDALAPYRPGIRRVIAELPGDPVPGLLLLPGIGRSMAWALEAAGLRSDGWRGLARVHGLTAIYARVFRVWLDDESPDLARTMAELDARLRRAERFAAGLRGRRSQGPAPESTADSRGDEASASA
ncbi:TetR family transcriptional regulator [Arenibaculum sp.]|uniref:TetR family transcriptional regulator n=1 Tax=Arenibaculum sp. TaxID=2865862 RepID=UPI002E129BDA|nr:TetR family transcriptional regulator [Arenibaculum sp.]